MSALIYARISFTWSNLLNPPHADRHRHVVMNIRTSVVCEAECFAPARFRFGPYPWSHKRIFFEYGSFARTNASRMQMMTVRTVGFRFADMRNLGYTQDNILIHGKHARSTVRRGMSGRIRVKRWSLSGIVRPWICWRRSRSLIPDGLLDA